MTKINELKFPEKDYANNAKDTSASNPLLKGEIY